MESFADDVRADRRLRQERAVIPVAAFVAERRLGDAATLDAVDEIDRLLTDPLDADDLDRVNGDLHTGARPCSAPHLKA